MASCNVILAGERRLFLRGLSLMLESKDVAVTGTVPTSELLAALATTDRQPDIVLWDSSSTPDREAPAWGEIHHAFPQTRIVVMTDETRAAISSRAYAGIVCGFLPKCISVDALSLVLRLINLGENLFTMPVDFRNRPEQQPSDAPRTEVGFARNALSSRETEILRCLGTGSPNKVIARELGIAESTIKVHVKTVLRKINASNRTQAAIWARSHGIMN